MTTTNALAMAELIIKLAGGQPGVPSEAMGAGGTGKPH